ncbi:hypothetical protein HLRTI_000936 [Halorhabdus tiamatea SARL4B]|uniref:Uncharacterized protein n=1 Tax=Halorhabdus tiamatea SARL4B TaxID=1033806 RepID=U2E4B6_9EURY|nr:hypothetical protein [Halorhabdus tiamatea]ERJ07078.1 hypothetical protein HLRTI_000936 [Halorhabdus tiamatea SARL4B]
MSRSDRWVNKNDPTDVGKDFDSDYINQDNDGEPADDCISDTVGPREHLFDPKTDPDDEFEHGDDTDEYESNTSLPNESGARTIWDGKDANAFEKGGLRYKHHVGLPTIRGDGGEFDRNKDDNYRYVNTIVTKLFPSKEEWFTDRVTYMVMDDPYLNSAWSRHYDGIIGATVGYCGVIMDDDSPIETIVSEIGVQPNFEEKTDIADCIGYAEKRIEERKDVTTP